MFSRVISSTYLSLLTGFLGILGACDQVAAAEPSWWKDYNVYAWVGAPENPRYQWYIYQGYSTPQNPPYAQPVAASDLSPANLGQLKNIAVSTYQAGKAYLRKGGNFGFPLPSPNPPEVTALVQLISQWVEFDEPSATYRTPGVLRLQVEADGVTPKQPLNYATWAFGPRKLAAGSLNDNNYAALNLGQVRQVAELFYRAFDAYYAPYPSFWKRPWLNEPARDDYSMATVGDLKRYFLFDFSNVDSDNDGISDYIESAYVYTLSQGATFWNAHYFDVLPQSKSASEFLSKGLHPTKRDGDEDGVSDRIEYLNDWGVDQDLDGLSSAVEAFLGTSDSDRDSDDDQWTDYEEVFVRLTNPLVSDAGYNGNVDTDSDGLPSGAENTVYFTNPSLRDTDGDQLSDGDEVLRTGTNPLVKDSDNDGIWDGDEDSDGDGLANLVEITMGRNPGVNEGVNPGTGTPGTGTTPPAVGSETFTYDRLGRLRTVTPAGQATTTISPDAQGNYLGIN